MVKWEWKIKTWNLVINIGLWNRQGVHFIFSIKGFSEFKGGRVVLVCRLWECRLKCPSTWSLTTADLSLQLIQPGPFGHHDLVLQNSTPHIPNLSLSTQGSVTAHMPWLLYTPDQRELPWEVKPRGHSQSLLWQFSPPDFTCTGSGLPVCGMDKPHQGFGELLLFIMYCLNM